MNLEMEKSAALSLVWFLVGLWEVITGFVSSFASMKIALALGSHYISATLIVIFSFSWCGAYNVEFDPLRFT